MLRKFSCNSVKQQRYKRNLIVFGYLGNHDRDNDDDLEIFMGCGESQREKREEERAVANRVRSSRITRCRRWYNARISRECVSFHPAKSLVGIERTEDRGSRRFDTTSRLTSPWLETPRYASGNRKNSRRASRSFLFGACLSARSNKSLRVTVQRPQVSANTKPLPVECLSRTLERLRSTEELQ